MVGWLSHLVQVVFLIGLCWAVWLIAMLQWGSPVPAVPVTKGGGSDVSEGDSRPLWHLELMVGGVIKDVLPTSALDVRLGGDGGLLPLPSPTLKTTQIVLRWDPATSRYRLSSNQPGRIRVNELLLAEGGEADTLQPGDTIFFLDAEAVSVRVTRVTA